MSKNHKKYRKRLKMNKSKTRKRWRYEVVYKMKQYIERISEVHVMQLEGKKLFFI